MALRPKRCVWTCEWNTIKRIEREEPDSVKLSISFMNRSSSLWRREVLVRCWSHTERMKRTNGNEWYGGRNESRSFVFALTNWFYEVSWQMSQTERSREHSSAKANADEWRLTFRKTKKGKLKGVGKESVMTVQGAKTAHSSPFGYVLNVLINALINAICHQTSWFVLNP